MRTLKNGSHALHEGRKPHVCAIVVLFTEKLAIDEYANWKSKALWAIEWKMDESLINHPFEPYKTKRALVSMQMFQGNKKDRQCEMQLWNARK